MVHKEISSSPWAVGEKAALELPVEWGFVSNKCQSPRRLGHVMQEGWEDRSWSWLTMQAFGVQTIGVIVEEGCKRAWAEQIGNAHGQTGELIVLKPMISDAETQLGRS